jgi:iron complex outermembrane receptor protein
LLGLVPALGQAATAASAAEATALAVVVSASRFDTRVQDMPLHTTVLTREDIERSPAQTLDQVLRQVPGLLLPGAPAHVTDPTGQNIRFRGMDKKVLVLVDGVPVLDPFYTTVQWFKLPLSNVERVEVVRGGGSSLWGNLAVGGVINVVTRKASRNEGELSVSLGSRQTWQTAWRQSFVVNEVLSLSASADRFSTDGYNTVREAYRAPYWPGRGASSSVAENVRFGIDLQPSSDLRGFLRLGWHRLDEQIGGYEYGHNEQASPDLQAGLQWRIDADSRLQASMWAQRVQFDKFNGAGCYQSTTYRCGAAITSPAAGASAAEQTAPVLQYASSFDDNSYREFGASMVHTQRLKGLVREWQWGTDFRAIAGEDFQQSYRTPTAALPQVRRIQRANEGAGKQDFAGLFTQVRLRPLDALELTLAGRVDHHRSRDGRALQTNYTNVASPVASSVNGGAVPDLSKTAFNPSVSWRHELGDEHAWRGSVYKAFRAPGLNNMYRSFGSSSITIANPLLAPETLVGKEVGWDWQDGVRSLGVTLFQADVKDVVATYGITAGGAIPAGVLAICGAGYTGVANTACPGTVSFYSNGQDQRSQGLELTGAWQASPAWSFSGFATWTRSFYTRTTTGDPTRTQLPLVPRVVAGAGASWRITDAWRVDADLRYNGGMVLSNLTSTPRLRQGAYTTLNLGGSWSWQAGRSVFASVVNATDKVYTDGSASNAQGFTRALPRTFTVGVRAAF